MFEKKKEAKLLVCKTLSHKQILLALTFSAFLTACTSAVSFPGETKMNDFSATDANNVWQSVIYTDKQSFPNCSSHTLLNTKAISYDEPIIFEAGRATQGRFSEEWTYDRCGETVKRRVDVVIEGPESAKVHVTAPL